MVRHSCCGAKIPPVVKTAMDLKSIDMSRQQENKVQYIFFDLIKTQIGCEVQIGCCATKRWTLKISKCRNSEPVKRREIRWKCSLRWIDSTWTAVKASMWHANQFRRSIYFKYLFFHVICNESLYYYARCIAALTSMKSPNFNDSVNFKWLYWWNRMLYWERRKLIKCEFYDSDLAIYLRQFKIKIFRF